MASEEAEDAGQVAKLRSALESVDHKRRKVTPKETYAVISLSLKSFFRALISIFFLNQILQQMRSDAALFTLEEGSSPVQNPSTAAEDSRLASLISLDAILKQVKVFITLIMQNHYESFLILVMD